MLAQLANTAFTAHCPKQTHTQINVCFLFEITIVGTLQCITREPDLLEIGNESTLWSFLFNSWAKVAFNNYIYQENPVNILSASNSVKTKFFKNTKMKLYKDQAGELQIICVKVKGLD